MHDCLDVFSAGNDIQARRLGLARATVNFNGNVTLNFPVVLRTMCKIDVQRYPTDTQKCDMVFGSWGHDSAQIRVKSQVSLHSEYPNCCNFG